MFFSVLIMAHKRSEYLLEAVRSVINQSLSRELYEVIVVKSFFDQKIEDMLNEYGVTIVNTDKEGLSDKIKIGIEKCVGNTICFLEDDDSFTQEKLSTLQQFLAEDKNLDIIHNEQFFVLNGAPYLRARNLKIKNAFTLNSRSGIPLKLVDSSLHFNLSSLAINRRVANDLLNKMPGGFIHIADLFIFLLFYDTAGLRIYFTNKRLTYFRVHNSSHLFRGKFKDFTIFESNLSNREIQELTLVENIFKSDKTKTCIECLKNRWKLRFHMYSTVPVMHSVKYDIFLKNAFCLKEDKSILSVLEIGISMIDLFSVWLASRLFFLLRKMRFS